MANVATAIEHRTGDIAFLTIQEAAKRLRCSEESIRVMIRGKRIPYVEVNRKVRRIPLSVILAWERGEFTGKQQA